MDFMIEVFNIALSIFVSFALFKLFSLSSAIGSVRELYKEESLEEVGKDAHQLEDNFEPDAKLGSVDESGEPNGHRSGEVKLTRHAASDARPCGSTEPGFDAEEPEQDENLGEVDTDGEREIEIVSGTGEDGETHDPQVSDENNPFDGSTSVEETGETLTEAIIDGSAPARNAEETGVPGNEVDGDWETIERTELEKRFGWAVAFFESARNADRTSKLDGVSKLQLYGLHKIAVEGPCHEPPPMALKVSARAKWNAWQSLGKMSRETAMEQYIALLTSKTSGMMPLQVPSSGAGSA